MKCLGVETDSPNKSHKKYRENSEENTHVVIRALRIKQVPVV